MEIYLHLLSFLDTEIAHVIEILEGDDQAFYMFTFLENNSWLKKFMVYQFSL